MSRTNSPDPLLQECEPYFIDGVHTIAEFSRRTQKLVRDAVERHWTPLVAALDFTDDEVALADYWVPDKLQRAKSSDVLYIGARLKVSSSFEAAVYRYWDPDKRTTGIAVWTWLNRRSAQDRLSAELDGLPDEPPEPAEPWFFEIGHGGTFYICRSLAESEFADRDLRLDELITYYIVLLRKVGGVKRFLSDGQSGPISIETQAAP